jgi:hypothetical protein
LSRVVERPTGAGSGAGGVATGSSAPLGATVVPGGVNFSVFSKDAALVELVLFDGANAVSPSRVIALDRAQHRSYHYWHAFVPALARSESATGARTIRAGAGCGSIPTSCSSTRTVSRSPSPAATTARRRPGQATTPPSRCAASSPIQPGTTGRAIRRCAARLPRP